MGAYKLATHVVNEVAAISSQSKQLITNERRGVIVDGLNDGHDEGRDGETDPLFVEGELFGTETKDETRSHTMVRRKVEKAENDEIEM